MAKSKRTRGLRACDNKPVGHPMPKGCDNSTIELSQEAIDRHWSVLPPQAKKFILNNGNPDGMFPLSRLVKFWSAPQNIDSTSGNLAGTICGASWYLALVYMRLNMLKEARSLTINGSFIHQCYNTSIEYVKSLCDEGVGIPEYKLPYLARGIHSIQSPKDMESFIHSYLPEEYTHMMTSFANMSTRKHVMGYIDQISNDWNGTSCTSKNVYHRPSPTDEEAQINLVLVDGVNGEEQQTVTFCTSSTLKALFCDYAEKRGISLRSLRFSYKGKTLFLSSASHKTPKELGMLDNDVIVVHDTTQPIQSEAHQAQEAPSKPIKTKKKPKNKKAKRKTKTPQLQKEPGMTNEEYKIEHSKQLTKIHGEAETHFKQIRQRLNNLVIERSQPKNKTKRSPKPKNETDPTSLMMLQSRESPGGKAGKSYYAIQVGEVENLYKTTKTSAAHYPSNAMPTLDLHGYTREEALAKLDESLKVWVDSAMQGSYPFVRPATIVCGCGNQILSETVQEWIRSNDKVSNAPKIGPLKRRGFVPRAA